MIHAAIGRAAARPSPLLRALYRSAAEAGCLPVVVAEHERPWATATFVGTLYRIDLAPDPALTAWLAALPDIDIDLHGAIVVDLTVERPATIVALTMEIDEPW